MAQSKPNLPYQCKYNAIVGCSNLKGCASCGWSPEMEELRKARLREKLTVKPPVKTRSKKRTKAVTWRDRK